MARDYQINGQCLATVSNGSELGLTEAPVSMSFNFTHDEIQVNAWGGRIPPALQFMLSSVDIRLSLIHFDRAVLEEAMRISMGSAPAIGQMPTAGQVMKQPSDFVQLTLTSPVLGVPWNFPATYIVGTPVEWPIGAEKSVIQVSFRALPIPAGGDPYQGGVGSKGTVVWTH
jgi:hypothetical protein